MQQDDARDALLNPALAQFIILLFCSNVGNLPDMIHFIEHDTFHPTVCLLSYLGPTFQVLFSEQYP